MYNACSMNEQEQYKEDSLTLNILQAIEEDDSITQRGLAQQLGVALGLTNSYLKRCVKKGYIKIHQIPANRYLYYLTPKGFSEKSRLTAKYLTISFEFYRNASSSINGIYRLCEQSQQNKVLLCGVSELAEIACIRAMEHDVSITGVFELDNVETSFLGQQIYHALPSSDSFDACVITATDAAQEYNQFLQNNLTNKQVYVPGILGIT